MTNFIELSSFPDEKKQMFHPAYTGNHRLPPFCYNCGMRVRSVRRTDLKSLTPQNKQLKILGGIVSNPRVSATNEQYLPKTYSETAWIAAGIFNCVVLKLMICSLDFWFFASWQRTLKNMIFKILQLILVYGSH